MSDLNDLLLKHFPYSPTLSQQQALTALSRFITLKKLQKCFLLKGYAGTGKTTVIKSLIKTLSAKAYRIVMLAPTGRAAKIIKQYTGEPASTIHRYLYEITSTKDGAVKTRLKENKHKKQVFIVDEASMISNEYDQTLFTGINLLADLVKHVYSQPDNMMVFIGDTAQLPPVGLTVSPALQHDYLHNFHHLDVEQYEMKEVVRQQLQSGILANAHCTRLLIERSEGIPRLKETGFDDVHKTDPAEVGELLSNLFPVTDEGKAVVICRSNKQANRYNEYIRSSFYGFEDTIEKNERLMVVKNNYYWHESESDHAFIANGDEIKVIKILKREECYGLIFAHALIELSDDQNTRLTVKLLLDTLRSESPALPSDTYKKLFEAVKENYRMTNGKISIRKLREDPYLNALQVKYAYAITCHKAQGGQWETVCIDPGWMSEAMFNKEYLRWLYTAITRARKQVHFIGFPDHCFV
jgi:exodeoxyribonuclease-5